MPKFFRFPWASTGDKTTIPDETDVAGFVSYQQGYGNDYARDPASDPLAKLIERDKMNQLFSDLTENAQYWQTHAFPEYITAAQNGGVDYAYDELAIVRYDSGTGYKVYQNTVAGNTNLPTGAGWVEYKMESIIHAATEKTIPADADEFGIADSAASFGLKKITFGSIKSYIGSIKQDFRLTLTSGTPVTTSNVTGATTLYLTPYIGNKISLYDGSYWADYSSNEISIAVPATTNTVYDVFVYSNAGTPTLELTAWTNDTTRATALTKQDGIYVKTGDTTRRYVGTFRTTGVSGQTEDSLAKRYVWNYYNRVIRAMYVTDATASWVYTTSTWRQANANAANQLDFVIGVNEDLVRAFATHAVLNSGTAGVMLTGIGLDTTSSPSNLLSTNGSTAGTAMVGTPTAEFASNVAAGRHFLAWLEYSTAVGTSTWVTSQTKVGIQGEVLG